MAKGNRPKVVFVPAKYTSVVKDGKEQTYVHLEQKFKIGGGYGITVILPDDTPLVEGKDGAVGVFLKFYPNYPRNSYKPSMGSYRRR